jgi:hypothetical protein
MMVPFELVLNGDAELLVVGSAEIRIQQTEGRERILEVIVGHSSRDLELGRSKHRPVLGDGTGEIEGLDESLQSGVLVRKYFGDRNIFVGDEVHAISAA